MDFCKGPFKVVCRYCHYSESAKADHAPCPKGGGEEEAGMIRMPTLEISYNCMTDRAHESKWHAAHVLSRKTVCAGGKYSASCILHVVCCKCHGHACHAGFAASIAEQLSFKLRDFAL